MHLCKHTFQILKYKLQKVLIKNYYKTIRNLTLN